MQNNSNWYYNFFFFYYHRLNSAGKRGFGLSWDDNTFLGTNQQKMCLHNSKPLFTEFHIFIIWRIEMTHYVWKDFKSWFMLFQYNCFSFWFRCYCLNKSGANLIDEVNSDPSQHLHVCCFSYMHLQVLWGWQHYCIYFQHHFFHHYFDFAQNVFARRWWAYLDQSLRCALGWSAGEDSWPAWGRLSCQPRGWLSTWCWGRGRGSLGGGGLLPWGRDCLCGPPNQLCLREKSFKDKSDVYLSLLSQIANDIEVIVIRKKCVKINTSSAEFQKDIIVEIHKACL